MRNNSILILIFTLTLNFSSGQSNKSDIKKQKALADFASKLNGIWKSNTNSDMIRFIVSNKTFQGQLLFPYEDVQQVGPVAIKLDEKADGQTILLMFYSNSKTDTSDIRIADNKLSFDSKTFVRHKK